MSTTLLDNRELIDLQPATELWARYTPEKAPHRFQAERVAAAQAWQTTTRQALAQTIGFQDQPPVPFESQQIEVVDKGDYIREKVLIRVAPHSVMPVYLLVPKESRQPAPTVVAFHGHGYGVKDIVGLWQDGAERNTPEGYHKDFAVALCRRGFVVAAPEIAGFGERQTDFSYLNNLIGQSAPTTCLDERIKACVISGYFSTFKNSILAMHHCACNFVPGLHAFGEMYDLVGLIAPRPLLVEAGDYDPIFPMEAVKRSIVRTNEVYGLFGAGGQVETDYFEGRHQISGNRAYDFLWEKLTG
jgi:hypothetical protein